MKTTNPLYDKLNKTFTLIKNTGSILYLKGDVYSPHFITKTYKNIDLLDELHFIVDENNRLLIKRFGFNEYKGIAEYNAFKEMTVKDITGYCILENSSKTLILKNQKGLYTYLDYNINSRFYMLNLVPDVLEEAHSFDEDYKDYAKVSFTDIHENKKTGYICRDDFMAKNANEIKLYSNADIKEKELKKSFIRRF